MSAMASSVYDNGEPLAKELAVQENQDLVGAMCRVCSNHWLPYPSSKRFRDDALIIYGNLTGLFAEDTRRME